jgi:glycosyltransferase involved in cell wall biosynthesis
VTDRPIRLLLATPLYLPNIGGVERYVDVLARRLAGRGLAVTVLTTDPTRALPPREKLEGLEVVRVPAWPTRRDYLFAPGLASVVESEAWDLVHVQSYHTLVAPLVMRAARRAGLPYLVTFHGGGHSSSIRRRARGAQLRLLRPLLASAARLIALARFEIELYGPRLRVPRERFELIPTGADAPTFAPTSAIEPEPSLIASVGRLERYKGHHRLIEALPAVLAARPDARVWIAGAGPEEARLRRLARDLGVAARVEIRAVAADRPQELARDLARAALVVLLSDFETLPLTVLEALALRRPVLARRNSGLAELADLGLVHTVRDTSGPREIAAAIVEQLRRPSSPPTLELPTWEACAERHHDVYADVLREASRARDS